LDKKNLEKLEKMFYIKNRRYSPHRSIIDMKHNLTDNADNKYNITQLLDSVNNEFMKSYEEELKKQEEEDKSLLDDDDDYGYDAPPVKITIHSPRNSRNGGFDEFGVFRPKKSSQSKSNDEFSNDNNFQIIKNSDYSFDDIGGYDNIKAELLQISDILLHYERYKKYNVRTPKGIIFEGPPGNGKTLMAKGYSGELNVSFIPVSGSEFSEKYVGVGASRVRDLFKLAEDNKPCIIFIDEIDALARKRGNDAVSSNSEKDQTLNQLLINLDGFKGSNGIFVIGATNRIDLLDPALIRPGRMDKNIFIGNPDSDTRKSIIQIHLSGKPIDSTIKIDDIVEMTGGFSGAQIENLLNESMLRALRENREYITMEDLEYILNRIMSGWQSTENKYSDDIIQRIVIHEMGHAIVGFFSNDHSKLSKVVLNLWSPKTPGYTVFENNEEDINIYTKNGLFAHLMVLLGGRIAEELFYGYSVTTGARKDLEEAYKLAQNMILQYGMGKKNIYPDLSDQSKFLIDEEVNHILMMAHESATMIIANSKELIIDCSVILKKDSLLKPQQIVDIINKKYENLWILYNTQDIYKM
jgi:cell division protease FtsH